VYKLTENYAALILSGIFLQNANLLIRILQSLHFEMQRLSGNVFQSCGMATGISRKTTVF